MMTAALLENDDRVTSLLTQDFGGNRRAFQHGIADFHAFVIREHQNRAQFNDVPRLTGDLLDPDDIVGGHTKLLAARPYDCEHRSIPCFRTHRRRLRHLTGAFPRTFALRADLPGAAHWRLRELWPQAQWPADI